MSTGTLTMKFGGSSVGTTAALTQVTSIILHEYERWGNLILVISALDGVTDTLIEATHLAQLSNRRGYRRIVATVRTRHLTLLEELPFSPAERTALQTDIDKLLFDMLDRFQSITDPTVDQMEQATVDAIIGVGEKLAARIVAALLRQNGLKSVAIDTDDIIITDNNFGSANPLMRETNERIQSQIHPMLERRIIPVVTGFIGGTLDGKPTTLGRGGSDYTASILSICTDAEAVWMWSNVDGMMSSDPREVAEAHVIPYLSYAETAELAYFGARIIHPRMIGPLWQNKIPLSVKNVFKPQSRGTLISSKTPDSVTGTIKAVTAILGVSLTANENGPLHEIINVVNKAFNKTVGSNVEVTLSSQSSSNSMLCFVIPTTAGIDAVPTTIRAIEEMLEAHLEITTTWMVEPISIITLISDQIDTQSHLMAGIFRALGRTPILALAQGPSRCSLSIAIHPENTERTLKHIHQTISTGVSSDLTPRS